MNKWKEYIEFVPKDEAPAEIPKEIAVKYYICWPGEPKELTPDSCRKILKNLRDGQWRNIYLTNDPDLEEDFMQLESGGGLFALQYLRDNSGMMGEEAAWFSTYDPEHLDSDEETDIECSDGQSIIFRKYTTADMDSVMTAIEYFIHTGKLWNGIQWMKSWRAMDLKYNLSLSELMDFFCDTAHQGFPLEEIRAAEKRLGVSLPQAYRSFLLTYGNDKVTTHHNRLMEPKEIYSTYELIQEELEYDWGPEFQEAAEQGLAAKYTENPYFRLWQLPIEHWDTITEDYILIWYENQGVWSAGYRKKDLLNGVPNPPVYISANDDYVTYKKFAGNTEMFLIEMLREAAYGWHGGKRFTHPTEIKRVFSDAGIDQELLRFPAGNGSCSDGERLYFYHASDSYQELLVASRTTPQRRPSPCLSDNATEPSFTAYRPKCGPRRLALLSHQMQDLGMYRPKPQDGIPLHPLVALLLQKNFNHEPSTAYDWGKDIARIKSLTIDLPYDADMEFIFFQPPGEHFPPAPYYFDLHDWSVIGRMTKLQSLVIQHVYVDDFSFLRACKNLKKLSLYNTNFSDCRLLSELPNLKEADLRFCPLEHKETLQILPAKCLT